MIRNKKVIIALILIIMGALGFAMILTNFQLKNKIANGFKKSDNNNGYIFDYVFIGNNINLFFNSYVKNIEDEPAKVRGESLKAYAMDKELSDISKPHSVFKNYHEALVKYSDGIEEYVNLNLVNSKVYVPKFNFEKKEKVFIESISELEKIAFNPDSQKNGIRAIKTKSLKIYLVNCDNFELGTLDTYNDLIDTVIICSGNIVYKTLEMPFIERGCILAKNISINGTFKLNYSENLIFPPNNLTKKELKLIEEGFNKYCPEFKWK